MEAAERGRRGSRRQDKAVRHRRMLGIRAAVGILCGMVLCAVLSVGSSMCVRAEEIMALSGLTSSITSIYSNHCSMIPAFAFTDGQVFCSQFIPASNESSLVLA